MDDDSARTRTGCSTTETNYAYNGKLMLISVLVLVAICTITAFFHYYARCAHQRRRDLELRRATGPRADRIGFDVVGPATTITTPRSRGGLDRRILKSIPRFSYDSAAHVAQLGCAVCLSEFVDKESGRVLPNCNHCFHTDCIDKWFNSHSNCPLCRAPPVIENPVGTITTPMSVTGQAAAASSSSSSSSTMLVGITVESGDKKEVDPGSGRG